MSTRTSWFTGRFETFARLLLFVPIILSGLLGTAVAQVPQLLATGLNLQNSQASLYLDADGFVYIPEGTGSTWTLTRVPKNGGAKQIIATGAAEYWNGYYIGLGRIDATSTKYYIGIGGYTPTRIEEIARDGSSRRLLTVINGGYFLGVYGSTKIVYFKNFNTMYELGLTDGSAEVSITGNVWPRSEVKDGNSLFFTDYWSRNLYRYDPMGGSLPVALITGNNTEPWTFISSDSAFQAFPGYVRRVPRSGGAITTIQLPDASAFMLGADNLFVYFNSTQTSTPGIWRMPLGGGTPQVVEPAAVVAQQRVQFDGGYMYWLDSKNGVSNASLYRIATANAPPTADAGADLSMHAGELVQLSGRGSFDDNTPTVALTYSWYFVSKPSASVASLVGAKTMTPSFVADKEGTYIIGLVVADEAGLQSLLDTVAVSSLNQPPTANAGSPQLVPINSTVQLSGQGSFDPDGDPLAFLWTLRSAPAGSTASITGGATATPYFTPSVAGIYDVSLSVSDPFSSSVSSSVQITVATTSSYVEAKTTQAASIVQSLPSTVVTTGGNRTALTQFLSQVVSATQSGNTRLAIERLNDAISRTDGCSTTGAPDAAGPGRDWVTGCDAQATILPLLKAALQSLTN